MKNILIIHPNSNREVSKHSFGGASLIWRQKKFFEEKLGYKVKCLSLPNVGSITSKIMKYFSLKKRGLSENYQSSEKRWLLNLIFFIFIHYISKVDFIWKRRIRELIKRETPDLIISNYPTFTGIISQISNNLGIPCALYEHNVEWKLFYELTGRKEIYKPLIWLIRYIELDAIKKSNLVICLSDNDKKILIHHKVSPKKISVLLPFYITRKKRKLKPPKKLKQILKDKFVIGFVGAKFEPNIISVRNIIKIAKKLEDKNIVFLILGKVCDVFKKRENIPSNVILKGFVKDLDSYLSLCDAFINPKTICDTGVEIKIFDYLKFNKPIISTEMGARGFEKFKNIIITDNFDELNKKILELTNG
ncbi:MAG: glycosyltransferase [Candidatus Aenigmatarchaeota archaeon]